MARGPQCEVERLEAIPYGDIPPPCLRRGMVGAPTGPRRIAASPRLVHLSSPDFSTMLHPLQPNSPAPLGIVPPAQVLPELVRLRFDILVAEGRSDRPVYTMDGKTITDSPISSYVHS